MLIALLVRTAGSGPPRAQRHQDRDRGSPELSTAGLRSSGLSRWSPVAASVSLEPGPSHGSSSTMLPAAISPASHEDRTRLASRSNLILRNSKMHLTNQIAAFHRVLCFCKCKKMEGFGPPNKSRLWSRTCSTSEWSQKYSRYPGHIISFLSFLISVSRPTLNLEKSDWENGRVIRQKRKKILPRSSPVLVFTLLFPSKLRLHNSCLIFVVRTSVIHPLLIKPARCALRALGLLLADGTPTVGGGKTF